MNKLNCVWRTLTYFNNSFDCDVSESNTNFSIPDEILMFVARMGEPRKAGKELK